MRAERVYKEFFRRRARQWLGYDPYTNRHDALTVGLQGTESSHLTIPEEVEHLEEMQDEGGNFMFLIDFSLIDGDDTIM